MKFLTALAFLTSVSAFTANMKPPTAFKTTSLNARPDTASAVQAALEASKKFGATSPEAKVLWDAVEEMDSSDNSAAYAKALDEDCLIGETISSECEDYNDKLNQLSQLLAEYQPQMSKLQTLASELKSAKMPSTPSQPAASNSVAVQAALKEAQAATKKFGKKSKEARLAWADLEEIASADNSAALGGMLSSEECSLEEAAMEACEALEILNKALGREF